MLAPGLLKAPSNGEALWDRQGPQHLRGLAGNIPCAVYSFVSQTVTDSLVVVVVGGCVVTLCASIWNITVCKTECPCLLSLSRMLGTKQN